MIITVNIQINFSLLIHTILVFPLIIYCAIYTSCWFDPSFLGNINSLVYFSNLSVSGLFDFSSSWGQLDLNVLLNNASISSENNYSISFF